MEEEKQSEKERAKEVFDLFEEKKKPMAKEDRASFLMRLNLLVVFVILLIIIVLFFVLFNK